MLTAVIVSPAEWDKHLGLITRWRSVRGLGICSIWTREQDITPSPLSFYRGIEQHFIATQMRRIPPGSQSSVGLTVRERYASLKPNQVSIHGACRRGL